MAGLEYVCAADAQPQAKILPCLEKYYDVDVDDWEEEDDVDDCKNDDDDDDKDSFLLRHVKSLAQVHCL